MQLFLHFSFVAVLAAVAVKASPFQCEGEIISSSSFIGQNSDVMINTVVCSNTIQKLERPVEQLQRNVCGATCTTNCFNPSGGGPDPNDCQFIVDALFYDNQNIGRFFDIGSNSNITMQYGSCKTYFQNQASYDETYCRDDWASVANYVAFNCQAPQNAHGGNCVATDGAWYIQVQHV